MDKHMVATGVRYLYQSDDNAKQFFDWVGTRQHDSRTTSVDQIQRVSGAGRADAINLCKKLQQLGCGRFMVGRRGSKSRIEWDHSLLSLGEAATGKSQETVPVTKEDTREEGIESAPTEEQRLSQPFTIKMAKEKLAETLGISPDSIEITIKA